MQTETKTFQWITAYEIQRCPADPTKEMSDIDLRPTLRRKEYVSCEGSQRNGTDNFGDSGRHVLTRFHISYFKASLRTSTVQDESRLLDIKALPSKLLCSGSFDFLCYTKFVV